MVFFNSGNHRALNQAVVAEHDHRKQQLLRVLCLSSSSGQERGGLWIQNQKVRFVADFQIANDAFEPQGLRSTRGVLPPQVLGF